jgi:hypothetical protein
MALAAWLSNDNAPSLEELVVYNNGIGAAGLEALARALPNCNLTSLNASGIKCGSGDTDSRAFVALAESLSAGRWRASESSARAIVLRFASSQ